jgi:hypothetical protein
MELKKVVVIVFAILMIGTISPLTVTAAGPRSSKPVGLLEIETLLSKLGYWIIKADGVPDASTRHAIMAFQKVEGRKRTGVMSAGDLSALRSAHRPKARYVTDTAHIEIDLTRQVLFYVDETGTVSHVLPVSSGSGKRFLDQGSWKVANTPRGLLNIGRKIPGVHKSSLGLLYNPSFFSPGIAIHGSNSIPPYPASHGCVRIPRFADPILYRMIPMQMGIYLYD